MTKTKALRVSLLPDAVRRAAFADASRFRGEFHECLTAVRLGPVDDATAVTADQLRGVVERVIAAGQWQAGDPAIVIVSDAGYDVTRLAWVLRDLPVELVGRVRSDRVMRLPKPPRMPGVNGRPPKHGPEFRFTKPETWPEPAITRITDTSNYGKAETQAGAGSTPGALTVPPDWALRANFPG